MTSPVANPMPSGVVQSATLMRNCGGDDVTSREPHASRRDEGGDDDDKRG